VARKNSELIKEFREGEEGIDYKYKPKDYMDPNMPSDKLLEK